MFNGLLQLIEFVLALIGAIALFVLVFLWRTISRQEKAYEQADVKHPANQVLKDYMEEVNEEIEETENDRQIHNTKEP